MRLSGWHVVGIIAGCAGAGIVIFLEAIVFGLGAQALTMFYPWTQEQIFLDDYGLERPPPITQYGNERFTVRSLGDRPSCFTVVDRPTGEATEPSLSCSDKRIVSGIAAPFDAQHLCNPILRTTHRNWRLPFTSENINFYYFAAGQNKALALPAALDDARQLTRDDFARRFAPNGPIKNNFEMKVHDEAAPLVESTDCGDYSIIRVTTSTGYW